MLISMGSQETQHAHCHLLIPALDLALTCGPEIKLRVVIVIWITAVINDEIKFLKTLKWPYEVILVLCKQEGRGEVAT